MKVAVVGAGRVGTAVAVLLRRAGHGITAVSGRGATRDRAASFLPDGAHVDMPSSDAMIDALDRAEPGLGRELRPRFAFLPAKS